MKDMSVLEAKRLGVITCKTTESLKDVTCTMQHHNISSLVVVGADGYLAGVITRTDLVRACYERPDWMKQMVRDFMNSDVVTVELDDPMSKVMELLINRHIHRVVAVERSGR